MDPVTIPVLVRLMPFGVILPAFVIDPLTKPVTWIPVIVVPAGLAQPLPPERVIGHVAKAGGAPPPISNAATELDAKSVRKFERNAGDGPSHENSPLGSRCPGPSQDPLGARLADQSAMGK